MSNTRRASATKSSKPRGRTIKGRDGQPVDLLITIPGGGLAEFHAPVEAPPRRTRELEIVMLRVSPLLQQVNGANTVAIGSVTAAGGGEVGGITVRLSAEDAQLLSEFTDVAAWAYLKSLKDSAGQPLDLPETPDGILDLPGPTYHAVTQHAAKLLNTNGDGFGVDSLPDDLNEADQDLPTSA